jgi:hypothetical protein
VPAVGALPAPVGGLVAALAGEQVPGTQAFGWQEVVDRLDLDLGTVVDQQPGVDQFLHRPVRVGHI